MENSFDFFGLLKQLLVAIPMIIAATMALTEAIKRIVKIEKPWVNMLVSWLIAVACGCGFVAAGKLSFGLGAWDYLLGGLCGLIAGGAANKLYDWGAIQKLIELIIELFSKTVMKIVAALKKNKE